mmetsp:Transcript_88922/g.167572  ORF Transcript_88922/g.167572 Transcript_88922/m.167572 type:complete len:267 (-) Transcript_88922:50-850(-)
MCQASTSVLKNNSDEKPSTALKLHSWCRRTLLRIFVHLLHIWCRRTQLCIFVWLLLNWCRRTLLSIYLHLVRVRQLQVWHQRHRLTFTYEFDGPDYRPLDRAGWEWNSEFLAIFVEAEGAVVAIELDPHPISNDKKLTLFVADIAPDEKIFLVVKVDVAAVEASIVRPEVPRIAPFEMVALLDIAPLICNPDLHVTIAVCHRTGIDHYLPGVHARGENFSTCHVDREVAAAPFGEHHTLITNFHRLARLAPCVWHPCSQMLECKSA